MTVQQVTFQTSSCRRLPDDHVDKLRRWTGYTFILVKSTGEVYWACRPKEKDQVVSQFDPDADALLMCWQGEWASDIFVLTKDDLAQHYR